MSRWDEAFRGAMRREEPPEGFTARVMARVKAEEAERSAAVGVPAPARLGLAARIRSAFRVPQLRWATALAAIVLAVGVTEYRSETEKRAEGERARDQVMLALRITGGKLRMTQAMVRRINYAPREQ